MMDINTLASQLGGEVVGGRLLATVDGKKAYLTTIGDDGKPFLNELGLRISNELSHVEAVAPAPAPEAPAPKRGRRKTAEVVEPEPLELDLDI